MAMIAVPFHDWLEQFAGTGSLYISSFCDPRWNLQRSYHYTTHEDECWFLPFRTNARN
jgi:hypothetical protein